MAATDTAIHATEEQDPSDDHPLPNADVDSEEVQPKGIDPAVQQSPSARHHEEAPSITDGTTGDELHDTATSTGGQQSEGDFHDDAAMSVAEGVIEDEHQDTETITEMSKRPVKKNTKRITFPGRSSRPSQPYPRARTAQQYTANLKWKSEQDLKKDFIKQITLKKRSGDSDITLEPPKAKRRRQQKALATSHGDPEEAAPSTTTDVSELGAIPNSNSDLTKVSKKDRRKQIAAVTSEGDSNRHLGSQKKDANLGMTIWGLANVDCVNSSDYMLKGIKTPIRGWQLQAATRMVLRENSHGPPYGGILGDQMGMGKTLTSLVLIVGCPPQPQDIQAGCGGTLVVVPGPNVLKEWREAITRHTEIQPQDVLIYKHATNILAASQIARYKIVLTTYQEVLKYPSGKRLANLAKEYGEETPIFHDAVKHAAGPIFDIEWYRVVFDELHTIKNTETQTFHACYRLKSKRVWGLSGTPLINQSKEIFPYVKLIGVEGIETKGDFQCTYKKGPDALKRLDALINLVTIRRSHDNRFLGKQMLEGLPQFEAEVRWVNLSREERLIYDAISQHFDSQSPPLPIVSMAQKRRAISHPYLLEKTFIEIIDKESIQKLVDDLKLIEGNEWVYHQIGRRFSRCDPDNASTAGKGDPGDVPDLTPQELAYAPMNPFGKSAFGEEFSMAQLLELTIMDKESGNSKCGQCKKKGTTDCYRINGVADCVSSNDESTDEESNSRARSSKSRRAEKQRKAEAKRERRRIKQRKYGGDHIGNLPALEADDTLFLQIGVNENGGVPCAGTKLTVAKEIILQWQKEAPGDKIIIFVEFIKTAILLGIVLNLEDIPFVYLNGKLTSTEKVKAVDTFKTNPEVKILIASMKVGGQALNLTCANRVIQVDSWWNEAAGDQANGRVNRMGQLKPSHAVVIKARDTIDEHITDLQERKTEEIEHMLQDDGRVTEVLGEYEVMALTAPNAWEALKQRLHDEIAEEMDQQDVE
ncbi:SNF2 family domain-containing protein [Colletotrichum zoysiae]|uniref:SNF2 family domain-containing protein n=1 Tax=Colletotrichum zoysiae TaxID=1216348 RepID=A0AAD9M355_9PEZI|nr:SNF2 family domain-containing protein [Colletotrichum zoysiae]